MKQEVKNVLISIGWHGPSTVRDNPGTYAADVFSFILTQPNSRFQRALVDSGLVAGVSFGYALNLSVCIGCRKCAEACHVENNHDRRTASSYIRVLEMEQGSFDMERGNVDYDHAVPAPGKPRSEGGLQRRDGRARGSMRLWRGHLSDEQCSDCPMARVRCSLGGGRTR